MNGMLQSLIGLGIWGLIVVGFLIATGVLGSLWGQFIAAADRCHDDLDRLNERNERD